MTDIYENASLFRNISAEDLSRMYHCLCGQKKHFLAGETITSFDEDTNIFGIVADGIVRLERVDYFGVYSLLDRLERNDIFGETMAYSPSEAGEISAVCETDCDILFLDHERIIHPCSNVCDCHLEITTNLLQIIANKSKRLSQRVEILSNKTIRSRLLSYFSILAKSNASSSFELPFTVSALADYLCVDRSAMTRELNHMKKEGILQSDRRRFTLLPQEE